MAAVDGRRFNGTKYIAVGGLGREAVGRKRSTWTGYRLGVACALLLTIGSLLMSTICLRSQRKLEAENFVLKEDVEVLETKILNVEEKLSEVRIRINDVSDCAHSIVIAITFLYSASSRETNQRSSRPSDGKPGSNRMVFQHLR